MEKILSVCANIPVIGWVAIVFFFFVFMGIYICPDCSVGAYGNY